MLSKSLFLIALLVVQAASLVEIKLKTIQSVPTSTPFIDLSPNWNMAVKCLLDIPNQIYSDTTYWGVYATPSVDSLLIGCYYRHVTPIETRFFLFGESDLQTEINEIKNHLALIPDRGLRHDSISSYLRIYKTDSIHVAVIDPSNRYVKIYKNYRDTWRLKTIINSPSSLYDFKFKDNTIYFSSNNKLTIIPDNGSKTTIDNVLGFFLVNDGIWLSTTSGELSFYNGTRSSPIRTGNRYARKIFALSPFDTTFFFGDSLENNKIKDRYTLNSGTGEIAQQYSFLDNDGDIVTGNIKVASKTLNKAFTLPGGSNSNRIYNNDTLTIQLGNAIYFYYSMNYTPLFNGNEFADSLGFLDEKTKAISYKDTLHAFDYELDNLTIQFVENPLGFSLNDSIITLTTGQIGIYTTRARVYDGYTYDTLTWETKIYSRKISIVGTPLTTAIEDMNYSQIITTTDVDNDSSYIHEVVLPSWLSLARTSATQHVISGTPVNATADTVVKIIVTDKSNYYDAVQQSIVTQSYDTLIYNIKVNQVNDAPVIENILNMTVGFSESFSYQVMATDEENDPLSYSFVMSPTSMSISSTGLITWSPEYSNIGNNLVSVRVTDSKLFTDKNFLVIVTNDNGAPVITSTPVTQGSENQVYSYQVEAVDNEALTYSLEEAPEQMTISQTGLVTWSPGSLDTGKHHIIVKVADSYDMSQTQEYDLTIQNINIAPVILSVLKDTSIIETDSIKLVIKAVDPDSTPVTIKWYQNSECVSQSNEYKMITDYTSAGTFNIRVVVSDGDLSTEASLTLMIQEKNRPPVSREDTTLTFIEMDQAIEISSRALDPDGDLLIYSFDTTTDIMSNLLVEILDSTYRITLKGNKDNTLKIIISDGKSSVSFKVNIVADIPSTSVRNKTKALKNSFLITSNGKINYSVAKSNIVQFVIYDLKGSIVYKNVRLSNSGYNSQQFNITAGTYVYIFKIGNEFSKRNKIQIVK